MEDKKDKKIRLLSDEVDRLRVENEAMRKENAELQWKVNEMSTIHNEETIASFQSYEQELKAQIEKAKRLCSLYEQLIEKQKRYMEKEEIKFQEATDKAIADFEGAIK